MDTQEQLIEISEWGNFVYCIIYILPNYCIEWFQEQI